MPKARTNPERRAETRRSLVRAAHRLFAEQGFAETATQQVVAEAGVTRGALYYHFTDKTALFDAVVESIAADIRREILAAAEGLDDPQAVLLDGCAAFLDVCLRPENQRIWLIDARSVIGWDRWRELDMGYAFTLLRHGVAQAMLLESPTDESDAVARLFSGALNEAALTIAAAPNQRRARRLHDAAFTEVTSAFLATIG